MLSYRVIHNIEKMCRSDQEYLLGHLQKILCPVSNWEDRPKRLKEIMQGIVGQDIQVNCRQTELVWARTMVAYQLKMEGYSCIKIGKALSRDHSTILYMINRMHDALESPRQYKDILPIWTEFQTKIKDETNTGSI